MGATEFNYVVNVDTSRVMGAMHEVRSQMGMAMGGPSQGGGAPQQGGGFGAMVGGAASGIGAMANAMVRFPAHGRMGYGLTFTNPAMAYSPHFGMMNALSSPGMERLVDMGGLSAAARLRPPGVSPGDFFTEVTANRLDRNAEAKRQAFVGARTTLMAGGLGLLGGGAGSLVGGFLGKMIGHGFGGDFGSKAGKVVGGLAGFMLGDKIVSGAVQEHYADVERIGGVTRELGDIVGGGRGLSREQRYGMGRAVRQAAGDLNMDVQVMADVMAGARRSGMMPSTTDPGKLREKAKGLADAIDNAAQLLGTSMGSAMSVIKGMTGLGFGARGGVEKLVGMAGQAGISSMAMYGAGMQGAGIARRVEMNGRAGFDLFTQGILSAAGGGLSKRELSYVGGVTGLGRTIAMTQMGHTVSPMGDMQLMAMSGGGALPSNMWETAGMAMRNLAKGGDMIGNIIQFDVNKEKLREGLGAKGMQMMTRQAIMGQVGLMKKFSPNSPEQELFTFAAKNMYGLSSTAAVGMYKGTMGRGGGGGGGGGGGAGIAEAKYNAMVGSTLRGYTGQMGRLGLMTIKGRIIEKAKDAVDIDSGMKGMLVGGMLGSFVGQPMLGAGIGYGAGKIYDFLGQGGLSLNLNPAEQSDREYMRNAKRTDELEKRVRRRHGLIPFDRAAYSRLSRGKVDLDSLSLDMGNVDPYGVVQSRIISQLKMAGVSPLDGPAPGRIKIGDQYWSSREVNRGRLDRVLSDSRVNKGVIARSGDFLYKMATEHPDVGVGIAKTWKAVMAAGSAKDKSKRLDDFRSAAAKLFGRKDLPAGITHRGETGILTPTRRALLEKVSGIDMSSGVKKIATILQRNALGASVEDLSSDIRENLLSTITEGVSLARTGGNASKAKDLTHAMMLQDRAKAKILMKNSTFMKVVVKAAQSGDPVKFKDKLGRAALKAGLRIRPDIFAKDIATGPGAALLKRIGKKLKGSGAFGKTSMEMLGLGGKGGSGGKGSGRSNARGDDEFQGAFNPIGVGQTESALSLILTSLKSTADMIKTLNAKVNGLGKKR